MAKSKTPDLADWHVSFGTSSRVIRATTLHVQGGAFILTAPSGDILFAAPVDRVKFVKRLEPGEEPEADEAAPVAEPFQSWPMGELVIPDLGDTEAPPLTPDPESEAGVTEAAEDGAKVDSRGRKHGERGRFTKA